MESIRRRSVLEAPPSTEAYLMLSGTLFAVGLVGVMAAGKVWRMAKA